MPVLVPYLQCIVGDSPVAEHRLIACLCEYRVGEIVREIGPDQLFPGTTGDPDCCLIDITDRTIRADSDEGIKARLDQTPVVGIRPLGRLFCLLPLSDIAGRGKDSGGLLSRYIAVERGIVQDGSTMAVPVSYLQFIVCHGP